VSMALDETIAPVGVVLNLDAAPWRINGYRWYGTQARAAVAAQFGMVMAGIPLTLGAPAGLGLLGIVDRVQIVNNTAAAVNYNVSLSNGLQGFYNQVTSAPELGDSVLPNPGSPVQLGSSTTAAPLITTSNKLVCVPPNSMLDLRSEWTLHPGTELVVESTTVNIIVSASFEGRVWVSS